MTAESGGGGRLFGPWFADGSPAEVVLFCPDATLCFSGMMQLGPRSPAFRSLGWFLEERDPCHRLKEPFGIPSEPHVSGCGGFR